MPIITVAVSKTINAPANQIYSILADYQNHHPHILPKAFTSLEVEEGGQGAGTVFKAGLQLLGQKQSFRMCVTEPEPGRVLAETDLNSDLVTSFTVAPGESGSSDVTIATTFQSRPGVRGFIERLTVPGLLRRIYRQELQQLEAYIERTGSLAMN